MRFVVATFVLASFLAGCGGSTASPDREAEQPQQQQAQPAAVPKTRQSFVADARRICGRLDTRVQRMGRAARQPADAQLLAALDAWGDAIDELRELKPPLARSRRFHAMLAHFEASIRAARQLPSAEGEEALVTVAVMADRGQKGAAIAHSLGLQQCSAFAPAPTEEEFERYVLEEARKSGLFAPPPKRLKGSR